MKFLFTFCFGFLFTNSYCQSKLIGKWRRIWPNAKHVASDSAQWGDLTINPDSTFFIQGDTAISGSTVPGWHVGDSYQGVWKQPDKNHLVLREGNTFFLYLQILDLTDDKLVMKEANFGKYDKRFYMKYKRL